MELSALFIDIFMLYLEICVDKAQLIMEFVAESYLSFEYLPFGVFLCLFFLRKDYIFPDFIRVCLLFASVEGDFCQFVIRLSAKKVGQLGRARNKQKK